MSAYSLNAPRSEKCPYGGYSPEGDPVCHEHRQVRCHGCAQLFPQHVTRQRVVGTREDRVLREGMRPRVEETFGAFCPDCDGMRRRQGKVRPEGGNPRFVAALLCGAFVAGLMAFFWVVLSLI